MEFRLYCKDSIIRLQVLHDCAEAPFRERDEVDVDKRESQTVLFCNLLKHVVNINSNE
jgi:hypothetical protein